MHMSAEEVKEYWRDFCDRHDLSDELVAKGEAKIDADPEHWADHTMAELLESLSGFSRPR
jgi:hypothetical protein